MSLPVICPNCGLRFTSRGIVIEGGYNNTFIGCTETCPRCGKIANIQDGTYDFVGRVLTAVRAPGVLRADIIAFRDIALAVQSGDLSSEQAAFQIGKINLEFASLWKWMNENGTALAVVISIIGIFVALYGIHDSDVSSSVAHLDAQNQIIATNSDAEVQRKTYEILRRQTFLEQPYLKKPAPTLKMKLESRPKKQGRMTLGNRHDRRKFESIARRKS